MAIASILCLTLDGSASPRMRRVMCDPSITTGTPCIFETKRIKLFRSDVSVHSVTKVQGGSRYVLSLGWVLKGKAGD